MGSAIVAVDGSGAITAVPTSTESAAAMPLKDVVATLEMARAISDGNGVPIGGYCVHFVGPVSFRVGGRYYQDVKEFRFSYFKYTMDRLYVAVRRRARYITELVPDNKIARIEILPKKADEFPSFDAFARRFDRRFVSDEKLRELWNGGSGQHGGKYRPSDFKQIGPVGHKVVQDFLRHFADLKGGGAGYSDTSYLTAWHRSSRHPGRDITVSHLAGNGLVWYSSEFHGCGNGSYYILATKNTVLHLEND